MIAINTDDVEEVKVGLVNYRGESSEAKYVSVRWLSRVGQDPKGGPPHRLKLFAVGPGGEIPTHNHTYIQTMYIVAGECECSESNADSGRVATKICRPGDMV